MLHRKVLMFRGARSITPQAEAVLSLRGALHKKRNPPNGSLGSIQVRPIYLLLVLLNCSVA
jgi:hypothetical protein